MANTYATIANGGQRADVHVIDKVTSSDGTVKYQYKPHTTQAIEPDIDRDVSYAMQQVVLHGTGANAQALGRPAAGKTGTATNDAGDVSSSWFVGFTPQLATAVMYVRGDGDDALETTGCRRTTVPSGYFGAGYPTATWAAVMKADLAGRSRSRSSRRRPTSPAKQTDHAPAPTLPPPPTRRTSRPPTSARRPRARRPRRRRRKPTHGALVHRARRRRPASHRVTAARRARPPATSRDVRAPAVGDRAQASLEPDW